MKNKGKSSALYFRDFRLFWLSQLISLSGTWMQSVAQGWLVYSLTKSPFYLGMVAAASTLPILLFTLIGGIAADRFRKRNLLIATQALSIIPALMLGIFTDSGVITVYQVIFLAFFLGTVNAFDMPARQSFVIEMVGKGHLLNAIALNSAAFNGARLIGPFIAGITIAYLGLPSCFYLNAASFIPVIIALSMINAKGEIRISQESLIRDFAEGFYFIKRQRTILYMIILIAVFSLFGIPFISFLPVFAEEIFNAGPTGLGILVSATGLGALSAALMLAFKSDMRDKLRFMSLSGLCFSLALLCASFSRVFAASLLLLIMAGWGIVSFLATANSFIQMSTPDNLRGRVMSVYSFVFLGFTPIGNFLMGVMSERIGTTNTVAAAALVCLAGAGIFSMKHLHKKI
ncbi:MAG: MFS transporter [Thermodesulfovibrionales bacterium]|nr:MFS transporter [Thermodesulfovibrionales bacterium]